MKTKRLIILENSLIKKEKLFRDKLALHFTNVKSANGQPLNDKRNGAATMNRWEKQNQVLKNIDEGIEVTKRAIEKEKDKIEKVKKTIIPKEIEKLIEEGKMIQWRKHPNYFFVAGVKKARIVWLPDKKQVAHKYLSYIKEQEEYAVFRDGYNYLANIFNLK